MARKNWKKAGIYKLGRSDLEDKLDGRALYALKTDYKGYKPIEVVVDSAAIECVMSKRALEKVGLDPNKELRQGPAAKAGINYVAADGGEIANEGEQDVDILTKEKHACTMTWQVADIQRPLMAVASLTKTGHEVNFRKKDGEITNLQTGKKIHFIKKGGLFVVTLWMKVRKDEKEGLQGQGKK